MLNMLKLEDNRVFFLNSLETPSRPCLHWKPAGNREFSPDSLSRCSEGGMLEAWACPASLCRAMVGCADLLSTAKLV